MDLETEATIEEQQVKLDSLAKAIEEAEKLVEKLKEELESLTGREVNVNVIEVKNPDLDARLVGQAVAEQLAKRASFRRWTVS